MLSCFGEGLGSHSRVHCIQTKYAKNWFEIFNHVQNRGTSGPKGLASSNFKKTMKKYLTDWNKSICGTWDY